MIYYSFAISIFLHLAIFILGGMLHGSTPAQANNNSLQLITVSLYQKGVTEKVIEPSRFVKEAKPHKTETPKKPLPPVASEMVTSQILPKTSIDAPQILTTVDGTSTVATSENLVGQDIPVGVQDENAEPRRFNYRQEYIRKVKASIERNKKYPQIARRQGIEGVVGVQFCIAKDGRLKEVRIASSSGCKILDDEAILSVQRANPFLDLPDELGKEDLSLKVNIVFKLDG